MKKANFTPAFETHQKNGNGYSPLSGREKEVLQLAANGLSNKQIARALFVTDDTVDTHNRNIVAKLNASNMKNAVAIGIRNSIIN